MSEEKGDVSKQSQGEWRDDCEPVTCPNPKCNQVFMDLDEDFWGHGNEDIDCRKCKRPAKFVNTALDLKKLSKIIYVYKCDPCKIKFTRRLPAMKKYCPSCKTTYYMFWHILLKLPAYSSNHHPPEKAMLQSA